MPSLHADVLTVLAGITLPVSGRQVHQLVKGPASLSGVQKVLAQLVESGLVVATESGSAHLYRLNREHVAADAVLALTDLRGKLFDKIRRALRSWTVPPERAVAFGSAARGDGGVDSDIDLLLVRPTRVRADNPDWLAQVASLSTAVPMWSGNRASVIDVSEAQIRQMIRRREPIVAELERDQLLLVGTSVLELAR